MIFNRRPGNAMRVWRWSILRESRVDDIDVCGCRFLLGGIVMMALSPFRLRSEGFCSTRGCLVVLETSCIMLSKLLAFGKLGNDDFCEVFAGFPFN
uniref:Uncharacterized protein n=1 Tax=Oryza glumipatula TaxID=40148 RepID=A0A0D9YB96_9ORYZ